MDAERKRLADRILKLLALASGTSFAAEADSARAMAAELMERHNIALGEGSKDRSRLACVPYRPFAKGAKWEYIIINALVDFCRCKFFYDKPDVLVDYSLVGTEADLEMLRYMLGEIHRQRITAWLDYKRDGPDSFHRFCYGFAQALAAKIGAIIAASKGELREYQERLTIWYETEILHAPTVRRHIGFGDASSAAGLAAGGAASLNRGAVGQSARRIGYDRR